MFKFRLRMFDTRAGDTKLERSY